MQRKKGRNSLMEDLQQMADRLKSLNLWLNKQYASNVDL